MTEADKEVQRLRAIIESQKRLGKEGPFPYRRSLGRHANALWNENRELKAKVEALADELTAEAAALEVGQWDCPEVGACEVCLRHEAAIRIRAILGAKAGDAQ